MSVWEHKTGRLAGEMEMTAAGEGAKAGGAREGADTRDSVAGRGDADGKGRGSVLRECPAHWKKNSRGSVPSKAAAVGHKFNDPKPIICGLL